MSRGAFKPRQPRAAAVSNQPPHHTHGKNRPSQGSTVQGCVEALKGRWALVACDRHWGGSGGPLPPLSLHTFRDRRVSRGPDASLPVNEMRQLAAVPEVFWSAREPSK